MIKKVVLALMIIVCATDGAYARNNVSQFYDDNGYEPSISYFWHQIKGTYFGIKSGSMLSQVNNTTSEASQFGTSYNTNTKMSALRMFSISPYSIDLKPTMGDPIRLEPEIGLRFIAMDNATSSLSDEFNNNIKLFTFMFNVYRDFEFNQTISPYLMTGVGYANEGYNFAWHVGTGITFSLNEHFKFDMGLKYFSTGESSSINNFKGNYASVIGNITKAGYSSIDATFGFRLVN